MLANSHMLNLKKKSNHSITYSSCVIFSLPSWEQQFWLVTPPTWSGLKYHNYWMGCLDSLYRHSWFPDDESHWPWWYTSFNSSDHRWGWTAMALLEISRWLIHGYFSMKFLFPSGWTVIALVTLRLVPSSGQHFNSSNKLDKLPAVLRTFPAQLYFVFSAD